MADRRFVVVVVVNFYEGRELFSARRPLETGPVNGLYGSKD